MNPSPDGAHPLDPQLMWKWPLAESTSGVGWPAQTAASAGAMDDDCPFAPISGHCHSLDRFSDLDTTSRKAWFDDAAPRASIEDLPPQDIPIGVLSPDLHGALTRIYPGYSCLHRARCIGCGLRYPGVPVITPSLAWGLRGHEMIELVEQQCPDLPCLNSRGKRPINALYAPVLVKPPSISNRLQFNVQKSRYREPDFAVKGFNDAPTAHRNLGTFADVIALRSQVNTSNRLNEETVNTTSNGAQHSLPDDFGCFAASTVSPESSNHSAAASMINTDHSSCEPNNSTSTTIHRHQPKRSYVCTYRGCNARFTRIYDLSRHRSNKHIREAKFPCRVAGCTRVARKFPRKDKRNEHERKIHGRTDLEP